ncbi:activating signal cointegrator 1 complex subunit 1-like [Mizuhopecten yessoensis]|uniref:Activating signal cointegrator 1 complex subunit 1 n=1 Tax=Mizuhopecten yessoensis TaxID=6573 RepID=A0A210QTY4_MIZYE|nr:activating signal cointegrator 1 complex subunit 1-like [Mizuhopecten yessoensis]XP_021349788.1 activating signal cointegrator 1 complex subunit 1-like [Mizuhopecten yessoensis]XP_021349789.1 activating signal cointegrator 1 complex subunit 1-like [Mizuhopecten yessoensis]XP_021349790.1 activating signal cointegrator 1 complex subunit 1-like [Mizuhopecten yessoensis]XP_021349791.1 activating signal cointegrator 1 complex subunit 1-like [Mizuhopecten yessoensis]XP_021349792.1 activating sign
MMDVLRPQIIHIGDRCYRKNPSLHRDVEADEEEDYNEPSEPVDCGWNDEICDFRTPIEETDSGFQLSLDIPSALFKHIIGRKGETRRRIENETRTQIRIPKSGQEGPIAIVGVDRKGIVSAKTRIDVIVSTARQKEQFTHFLSIPVTSAKIIENFLEFKDDVLRECDGDRGIDSTIFQKQEKLHLTLGTLVLLSEAEVQQALDVLQQCHEDLVGPILKGQRLAPRIQGVEYMNDDPSCVDVLYAKLEPGEDLDKLQILVDRIVEKFNINGLIQQSYSSVKLHITIMNTLMRRDPTGAAVPRPQDRRSRPNDYRDQRGSQNKERESFDATSVLKKFGEFDFGEHPIRTIHLSQRQAVAKDGYYGCAGSLLLP